MIRDALSESSVSVGLTVGGWREAVEESGRLLVESGAVRQRYVKAMVGTVEELGAYAVIAPGVAIPHARPEDGVEKVGLSLVLLSEPVEFGSKENDPVDTLFGFSTTDADAHVELIQSLADFIESAENMEALRRSQTVEQAMSVFERES